MSSLLLLLWPRDVLKAVEGGGGGGGENCFNSTRPPRSRKFQVLSLLFSFLSFPPAGAAQSAQNNERQFDEERLGRGHLSDLREDNFEFGAWTPVEGVESARGDVGEAAMELLGSLFSGEDKGGNRAAARKSDSQPFPFTDAITVHRATERADSPRAARDSKKLRLHLSFPFRPY